MEGILCKISNNKNSLRTNEIHGTFHREPQVGKSFKMFAPGIEFGIREVSTSDVKFVYRIGCGKINEVPCIGVYKFNTQNSEYLLIHLA